MSRILECVYAYICQRSYLGECTPMDQLYTLTEGTTQSDADMLSSAVQSAGRVELGKVDVTNGVRLYPTDITPDFGISSFSYYPKINDGYSAISCASLRKSLKNKSIRGSKELTHMLLFNGAPEGFYAIDMIRSEHFKKYRDIQLDENASYANGNEDLVSEVAPEEMPAVTFDAFRSEPLRAEDVSNLGARGAMQRVAELFHALTISRRDNTSLYIVYDPEDYETMLDYLTIALKLMPAKVANQFSFVTCLGKTSVVNFNICCIPTSDKEYISTLKYDGNVITVTGLDTTYLSEPKGPFAEMLAHFDADDLERWLEASRRYFPYVTKIEHMDDIAVLYGNTLEKQLDLDDPDAAMRSLSEAMKVVSNRYGLITEIDGEFDRQLTGIAKQLDFTLGAALSFSIPDIKQNILAPIFNLLTKCGGDRFATNKLYEWLKKVLFGIEGQSKEMEIKHFEIVSRCFPYVAERLGDSLASFVSYLSAGWDELSRFFSRYLQEAKFSESSSAVVLTMLNFMLSNLSNVRAYRPEMRDYLTKIYLQNNPTKFDNILQCVFSGEKQSYDTEFNYIYEKALKEGGSPKIIEERIKSMADMFYRNGVFVDFMNYILERYRNSFGEDEVIRTTFEVLLGYYFVLPSNVTFATLYSTFDTAKKIVGTDPMPSMQALVFGYWYRNVAAPHYAAAIKGIRFEKITDEEMNNYTSALEYLRSPALKTVIPDQFIAALEKFLTEYRVYGAQKNREQSLINDRIEFVAREISLLDNKTIMRILNKYIGETAMDGKLQHEGITDVKKDRRLADFAKRVTRVFLSNPASKKRAEFCAEVREARTQNFKDYRIISRDILSNVLGSVMFTAVVTVIAALLSYLIYNNVLHSYFQTIYIVFVVAIAVISQAVYWSNYKNRRFKNVIVMSSWQMALMLIATLGVYTLIQVVFISLGI